jgi:hypothetical protein
MAVTVMVTVTAVIVVVIWWIYGYLQHNHYFCMSVCDVTLFQFHVVSVCLDGTFRWDRTVALKRGWMEL